MSWPCRLIARPEKPSSVVGDMWYLDPASDEHADMLLAPEHVGKRPLIVVLPGPVHFAVYGPTWKDGQRGPGGWKVVGDAPALTVTPSININGVWHGYLQDGYITADVEGRRFNEAGRRAT